MSSQPAYRQELPPQGGYKPVQFARIPAKQFLNSFTLFAGLATCIFGGAYVWSLNDKRNQLFSIEKRSAMFAVKPIIDAEKDRQYLLQLRKNRDEEERLMANVPGWVVGTLFGEAIYKTRPKDEWIDVTLNEFYAHTSTKNLNLYLDTHKYH